jgi:hypothetical protein
MQSNTANCHHPGMVEREPRTARGRIIVDPQTTSRSSSSLLVCPQDAPEYSMVLQRRENGDFDAS